MPPRAESLEAKQRALFARAETLRRAAMRGGALPRAFARVLGRQLRLIALGKQSPEEAFDVMPLGATTGKVGARKSTPFARDLRARALPGWGALPEAILHDEQLPLIARLRRLDAYGRDLEGAAQAPACRASPDLLRFLAWTLARTAAGDDVRAVLGVRAKRGENYQALAIERRDRQLLAWLAAASDPSGPSPMTRSAAIEAAAVHFQLGKTTVRKIWNSATTHRDQVFSLTGDHAQP